jgi:hypothetical protein
VSGDGYKRRIWNLAAHGTGHWRVGLTCGVMGLLGFVPFAIVMSERSELPPGCTDAAAEGCAAVASAPVVALVTVGLAAVCFATCFVAGLWATHRAYGPLPRLNRMIEAMTSGDFSNRIQVRGSDDIRGLADRLNALAETLDGRPRRKEAAPAVRSTGS